MSSFKSTIWAYDYYLEDGLFKNAVFPTGIDPDIVHDVIMAECGEMQPLFTDADFMQQMIGVWCQKWAHTFERWVAALETDYDPLYNYDRHEDITDTRKAHMYGNIGVTTSQQMLRDELSVAEWNIYEHIKDLFMQDFCIMIY